MNGEKDNLRIKNGIKVSKDFIYSSNNNSQWMTKIDLKKWIDKNFHLIGHI